MCTDNDRPQLLCADEVAEMLRKPTKTVYDLPIPQVRLGPRTVRWKLDDILEFIDDRRDGVAA